MTIFVGLNIGRYLEQIVRRKRALRRKDNSKFLVVSCSPEAPRPAKSYSKHSRHRRLGSRNCVPDLDLVACRRGSGHAAAVPTSSVMLVFKVTATPRLYSIAPPDTL